MEQWKDIYKDAKGHWRDHSERLVWCNPARITFQREEMEWLLSLLPDLRNGFYVPEPRGAYVDAPITKRRIKSKAYFEVNAILAAELDWRLSRVWQGSADNPVYLDYYLLIGCYCDGLDEMQLASVAQKPIEEISKRIRRALNYISGFGRRTKTYEYFVCHHKPPPLRSVGGG